MIFCIHACLYTFLFINLTCLIHIAGNSIVVRLCLLYVTHFWMTSLQPYADLETGRKLEPAVPWKIYVAAPCSVTENMVRYLIGLKQILGIWLFNTFKFKWGQLTLQWTLESQPLIFNLLSSSNFKSYFVSLFRENFANTMPPLVSHLAFSEKILPTNIILPSFTHTYLTQIKALNVLFGILHLLF